MFGEVNSQNVYTGFRLAKTIWYLTMVKWLICLCHFDHTSYVLNYYLHQQQKKSTMYFLCSCSNVKHLLLLRWDMGKVSDWFDGMGRFKVGLWCKGREGSTV